MLTAELFSPKNLTVMRFTFSLFLIFLFFGSQIAEAQFRDSESSRPDFTGNVTTDDGSGFFNSINFQMNHSYEMTAGSFGGQGFTQNFYTNSMNFLFNEDLRARVDLSVAHSPFGNNIGNQQGTQFFVRNAMLQYDISDNSSITFQFRQIPVGSYGAYGMGAGAYGYYSPFERSNFGGFSRNDAFYGW
jgi:hypothetical protein